MATNSTADYEYKFITEPEDVLKCLICHEVVKDPKQHEECGKLFCKKCIEKYGVGKTCPYCRMKQPLYFKDNRSELASVTHAAILHVFSWLTTNT